MMCTVGTYTVIAQAQAGEMSIISRHNITVCDWKSSGAWSDACMWNVPPVEHDHVTIEEGMDLTLDVTPPQLSSLTVSPGSCWHVALWRSWTMMLHSMQH